MSIHAFGRAVLTWILAAATILTLSAVTPPAQAASPGDDGKIAFVRGDHIFTMTSRGARVTQLTTSGRNEGPTWSPDGRRLSFVREAGGRRDVWVMFANGGTKRAVTTTGDVTSTSAAWSPDGQSLAYAVDGQLRTIRSTAPFGQPSAPTGVETNGFCSDPADPPTPVYVDKFLAWSPDGRIATFHHYDCQFDDVLSWHFTATAETRQYAATGADCCGYLEWSDVFWGPGSQFGYTQQDTGAFGDDSDAPLRIVYPGFASLDGDTGGAPSPSGGFLALSNASSGTSLIIRAKADGSARKVLGAGSQPDWQPRP